MGGELINFAEKAGDVKVLGPGLRVVLWVQGCLKDCHHCISQNWRPLKPAFLSKVSDLAEWITSFYSCRGLTISGGEPMLQAESICALWKEVKIVKPEWDLIVFSGYNSQEIIKENNYSKISLLKFADAFIGGSYDDEKNDGVGLRGSSNQEVLFSQSSFFSPDEKDEILSGARETEVRMLPERVLMIGIPNKDQNIEKSLLKPKD